MQTMLQGRLYYNVDCIKCRMCYNTDSITIQTLSQGSLYPNADCVLLQIVLQHRLCYNVDCVQMQTMLQCRLYYNAMLVRLGNTVVESAKSVSLYFTSTQKSRKEAVFRFANPFNGVEKVRHRSNKVKALRHVEAIF